MYIHVCRLHTKGKLSQLHIQPSATVTISLRQPSSNLYMTSHTLLIDLKLFIDHDLIGSFKLS